MNHLLLTFAMRMTWLPYISGVFDEGDITNNNKTLFPTLLPNILAKFILAELNKLC